MLRDSVRYAMTASYIFFYYLFSLLRTKYKIETYN